MIDFDKFVRFVELQLETGDYDAVIPFMLGMRKHHSLDLRQAVELGLLYMAYYNEASAWTHYITHEGLHGQGIDALPIETQRRNLYGGRIHLHLAELHAMNQEKHWLDRLHDCATWAEVLDEVGSVYGNGRWSAFTGGELLLHICEANHLLPDSYEVMDSSGPLKGLVALGLEPSEEACGLLLNSLADLNLLVSCGQLESLLCDWSSVCKGQLYAGRSIDRQQDRILKVEDRTDQKIPSLWHVRQQVYPLETLGELNGWVGIDRDRLKHYKLTGEVLAPQEKR